MEIDDKLRISISVLAEIRSRVKNRMHSEVLGWHRYCVFRNTFRLFKDFYGRPKAYVVWAKINRESLLQLHKFGEFPNYSHEWEEGNITLIMDIAAPDGLHNKQRESIVDYIKSQKLIAYHKNNKTHLFRSHNNQLKRIDINSLRGLSPQC